MSSRRGSVTNTIGYFASTLCHTTPYYTSLLFSDNLLTLHNRKLLMDFFEKIKTFFYQQHVRNRLKKHSIRHEFVNIKQAKNIGLLFDANFDDNIQPIQFFAQQLTERNIEVSLLGYVDKKPAELIPDFPIFSKKDVSFLSIPKQNQVIDFYNEPFDLLISYFTNDLKPLAYISMFSRARCRVGPFIADKTDCFDIMINTETDQGISNYIKKVNHYIEAINNDA